MIDKLDNTVFCERMGLLYIKSVNLFYILKFFVVQDNETRIFHWALFYYILISKINLFRFVNNILYRKNTF